MDRVVGARNSVAQISQAPDLAGTFRYGTDPGDTHTGADDMSPIAGTASGHSRVRRRRNQPHGGPAEGTGPMDTCADRTQRGPSISARARGIRTGRGAEDASQCEPEGIATHTGRGAGLYSKIFLAYGGRREGRRREGEPSAGPSGPTGLTRYNARKEYREDDKEGTALQVQRGKLEDEENVE